MADASLQIGNGNWAVKTSLLLGYNVVSNRYNPIEIGVTRETTGSRTNVAGIIDYKDNNIARINYEGGVGSLLLEPQRTNLALRSEELDNISIWGNVIGGTGVNPIRTANTTISPSGAMNADTIFFNRGSGNTIVDQSTISQNINIITAGLYTFSVWVKATTVSDIGKQVFIRCGSASALYPFILTSSWVRIQRTDSIAISASDSFQIGSRGVFSTSNSVSVDLWGAQLEQGAYPTSYIPTTTTALTRNADVSSKSGISDLIGQTEGTIFCDVTLNSRVNFTYFVIANSLASTDNYLGIAFLNNAIAFESVVATVLQAKISHSNTSTGRFKIAAAYKANDFILYINGTKIGTDTSGTIPTCSQLGLNTYNQAQALNYNSVQLYQTRLTNSELAQLTTL
jgi:hypothetical protein